MKGEGIYSRSLKFSNCKNHSLARRARKDMSCESVRARSATAFCMGFRKYRGSNAFCRLILKSHRDRRGQGDNLAFSFSLRPLWLKQVFCACYGHDVNSLRRSTQKAVARRARKDMSCESVRARSASEWFLSMVFGLGPLGHCLSGLTPAHHRRPGCDE